MNGDAIVHFPPERSEHWPPIRIASPYDGIAPSDGKVSARPRATDLYRPQCSV